MRIYRGEAAGAPPLPGRWALTLGTFDGVHRGHQAILCQARRIAVAPDFEGFAAVTFHRHPRSVLAPDTTPPLLTGREEKVHLLRAAGVDALYVLDFDDRLAQMEYDVFVREILRDRLGLAHFVLGHDVHFGRERRGNYASVAALAEREGFALSQVASVREGGEPVSSTRIRHRMARGDLDEACRLMGHPYPLFGRVVRGRGLGKGLGFPTANVVPHHRRKLLPPLGVYAGWGREESGGDWRPAVVNVGRAPTVVEAGELRVEAHLLEGAGELYGRDLELALGHRLREERRFGDERALREAIAEDVARARELLGRPGPAPGPEALDRLPGATPPADGTDCA